MELIFASSNAHKVEEIQAMAGDKYHILSLKDIGYTDEIPETGETLKENAILKAETLYKAINKPCFADDSGLEVVALDGAPGVYSARYAGEHGNHAKNIAKLLENLMNIENRAAQFATVIAFHTGNEIITFEGAIKGHINHTPTGNAGFGYDPVFIPEEHTMTFAEMDSEAKNSISHRKKAFEKMINYLNTNNLYK